jgi:hypothetical protein
MHNRNLMIFINPHQSKKYKKYIIFNFILLATIFAQPKLSFHLGTGFYNPSLGYLDPDSNNVIPSLGAFGKNILLDWGVKYQFYPNARIGYSRSNSYHSGKIGKSDYLRTISYRMLTFETFYYPRKKMELNFMLAPMYNKGIIKLSSSSSSSDWSTMLIGFKKDNDPTLKTSIESEMTKRWFGLASMVGFRYYIYSWFAVDAKAGFLQNSYKEKDWKLEGEKIDGPTMNIKKMPVFKLHLIFGW